MTKSEIVIIQHYRTVFHQLHLYITLAKERILILEALCIYKKLLLPCARVSDKAIGSVHLSSVCCLSVYLSSQKSSDIDLEI